MGKHRRKRELAPSAPVMTDIDLGEIAAGMLPVRFIYGDVVEESLVPVAVVQKAMMLAARRMAGRFTVRKTGSH